MDQGRRNARRRAIVVFIVFLCIALVFLGISAYMLIVKRAEGSVSDRSAMVCQICALAGIFFLVLDFGHLLPSLFSHNKIYTEANMRAALSKYIPYGEALIAGIYAIAQESKVDVVYGKCRCMEGKLVPDENAGVVSFSKEKYAEYEVYLGITQSKLLIVECGKNKHYYQYSDEPDMQSMNVETLCSELDWEDIGTVFSTDEVQSCKTKKGRMGRILCTITMKNGTYFKLALPDNAGANGEMPHHMENREAIITRLCEEKDLER